jgi:hypothetical protein
MAMSPSASNKFFTISMYIKDKILLHGHYHWLLDCMIAKFALFNRRKFEKPADDAISVQNNVTHCNANAIKENCLCFDT